MVKRALPQDVGGPAVRRDQGAIHTAGSALGVAEASAAIPDRTGADGGATQGSGDSAGVYGCAERKARMPEEAKMVHPTSQPLPGAAAEDE